MSRIMPDSTDAKTCQDCPHPEVAHGGWNAEDRHCYRCNCQSWRQRPLDLGGADLDQAAIAAGIGAAGAEVIKRRIIRPFKDNPGLTVADLPLEDIKAEIRAADRAASRG